MSWLIKTQRRHVESAQQGDEILLGVSCAVRRVGEDLLVEGRARTRGDCERLKRIIQEMLDEALGGIGS